jgi:ketosteroid isomerase-like protein
MKNSILVFILLNLLVSCNQKEKETDATAKSPADSLISMYINAWNNNDSAAICNLFAEDAIVVDDELVMMNIGEIAQKWAGPYHLYARNLKTEKLKEWATDNRAGYTGMYALEIVVNDTLMYSPYGIFTMVWEKSKDGSWKVSTANMNALPKPAAR